MTSFKEQFRARAEAAITLGLAQKTPVFRFHQEDDSTKCTCGFDKDCSQCYGTEIVNPYEMVEEVVVEKPHHSSFSVDSEEVHFIVCHTEPLQRHDTFYWRDLGVPEPKAYYVIAVQTSVDEVGVTDARCRSVPSWSPLNKFPLEKKT